MATPANDDRHPRLRPVEAFPVEAEGRRYICLRDPSGFAENPVFVPEPLVPIVALFDGQRSIRDIQTELAKGGLGVVPTEKVIEVADALDRAFFLEGAAFAAEKRRVEAAFRQGTSRSAAHAGGAYPNEPEALRAAIDSYFAHADGPPEGEPKPQRFPRAILSPHIDFHRGGPTYAAAYHALKGLEPPDTIVVLGTWHASGERPFVLTEKDYDTPLGAIETDREFVRDLARRAPGAGLFDEEIGHRHEHSVEFQAVMLARLFENAEKKPKIVPILVGSMHGPFFETGDAPATDPRIGDVLEALRETLLERDGRAAIVGGVDLAHVGPRFGDRDALTREMLAHVEREDRAMLDHVLDADATAFFGSIAKDGDRRRICGYPPIYAILKVLPAGPRGRLVRYKQCTDKDGTQSVTIASMVFE